ncbi:amino acid transmembrane transporter [Aureococcus anophagefferens]|nr:amino acid transmembrane transporter [Aureococcus anophagefferens]
MAVDLPTPFSFTNIFKLHAVVAFVFLLPVLNGGLKGFIETITEAEQRMLAATFMFMTAAALLNMFLFPAGDRMPPMGVGYTVIMTWLYGAAFAQKVDEGKKTK